MAALDTASVLADPDAHLAHRAVIVVFHVEGTRTVDVGGARVHRALQDPVIQVAARHRRTPVRQGATRPRQKQFLTESGGAQPAVHYVHAHPLAETETIELMDCSWR